MIDPDDRQKLLELDDKIRALKAQDAPREERKDHHRQTEAGWRMVIELVSGLLIGVGIGYGLDSLFGTIPIFLILFTLLGFAAGINVMLRSAKELQSQDDTGTQGPDES
ncbi:AtpZ/AtpI family protein [Pseudaestuariivita atlantica]|uniref:ATP synthase protein I n=1 Tax=Pseudaestuariivita atlantica TaxID=1317121 RepID=A0A0L1JSK5_9RHOB|nr:AtpZ/AtpI family protein [Pseudaestuariivita atlantica]KNG94740.1 ATP synthase F0 subunit I [Pseudaestuariivita atlantica]